VNPVDKEPSVFGWNVECATSKYYTGHETVNKYINSGTIPPNHNHFMQSRVTVTNN